MKPTLVEDLDRAMRQGTYTDAFWTQETAFTVDELWAQYAASPSL